MNSIVRNLEIYDMVGVGNPSTIELHKWINDTFENLTISEQDYDILLYSKNNIKLIAQDNKNKYLFINNAAIWSVFKTKFIFDDTQIIDIIQNIMFKKYTLKDYKPLTARQIFVDEMFKNFKITE